MAKRSVVNDQAPSDDFLSAYAVAMLTWQSVEHSLFVFFYSLFNQPGLQQPSAIYYSQDSFGAKLRIVEATAKVVLSEVQHRNWVSLCKKLRAAAEDRNVLAHFTAVADFQQDNSISLVLAPALFVPSALKRKRTKKYDAEACRLLAATFKALSAALEAYAKDHSQRCTV
jgi:hypothetical protein